jgi:hypothetical protein
MNKDNTLVPTVWGWKPHEQGPLWRARRRIALRQRRGAVADVADAANDFGHAQRQTTDV